MSRIWNVPVRMSESRRYLEIGEAVVVVEAETAADALAMVTAKLAANDGWAEETLDWEEVSQEVVDHCVITRPRYYGGIVTDAGAFRHLPDDSPAEDEEKEADPT